MKNLAIAFMTFLFPHRKMEPLEPPITVILSDHMVDVNDDEDSAAQIALCELEMEAAYVSARSVVYPKREDLRHSAEDAWQRVFDAHAAAFNPAQA